MYRHFCFGHYRSIFIKQTALFQSNTRVLPVQLSLSTSPTRAFFHGITADWSFVGGLLAPLE
jgi:hypothetical protein